MTNDAWHRQQYEAALRTANVTGPDWDDLSDEQRENIRAENQRHSDWMNLLGNAISMGGPLPSLDLENERLNAICDRRAAGPFVPVNIWDL